MDEKQYAATRQVSELLRSTADKLEKGELRLCSFELNNDTQPVPNYRLGMMEYFVVGGNLAVRYVKQQPEGSAE